jgi:predicted transcriptional regulator
VIVPTNTPEKVMHAKMRALYRRGLVGGCDCGCRGDWEITDKGLELIGQQRIKPYSGY